MHGIRSVRLSYASMRHVRIYKYFLRDDISKSIADRALKLAHELDNCINIYNPEDQVYTVFSFSVVPSGTTPNRTKMYAKRACILTMASI